MHRPSCWPPLPFVVLASFLLLACGTPEAPPPLVDVLDLTPREAEVGDRLEIIGRDFPEGRPARVTFRGILHRPGSEPVSSTEIDADGTSTAADRVDLPVDERLQAAFCGEGEQAQHTTFEGDVVLSFPAASPGALPVTGSLRHVAIDFRPPSPRRAVLEAQEADGSRALAFLGIVPADASPPAGGLAVASVRPGSPAELAGMAAGDVLTSFDGVRIFGKSDVRPSGEKRRATIGFRRPGVSDEQSRAVCIDGFRPAAPADLLATGLVLSLVGAFVFLFFVPGARALTWLERRVTTRLQARAATAAIADRPRPGGFTWLALAIQAVLRQDLASPAIDAGFRRLVPYLAFIGAGSAFCLMPFGQKLVAPDLDVGILCVVVLACLSTVGLFSGRPGFGRDRSLFASLKFAARIASYGAPAAVAVACIVMMTGSLRMEDIVQAQGGTPWQWFVFKNPMTLALFFFWLMTALADTGESPVGWAETAGELRERRARRRSAARSLLFFFAEWTNLFVMCGLGTALFLGGWRLPGVDPFAEKASFGLQCAGAALFQIKSWALVLVVLSCRANLPRLQIEQMMSLCTRWLVPASLAAWALSAGWMMWNPIPPVQSFVALGTFSSLMLLVGYFIYRVGHSLRTGPAPVHVNPFL